MACYKPMRARQDSPGGRVVLWAPQGDANLEIPCGRCIGCKTDRATQWGHRCEHEAKLYTSNIFLTLTYDDTHLPYAGHLIPRDLTLFFKRLRKYVASPNARVSTDRSRSLRYFACGEYGETGERPHYHACIFNVDFPDKVKVGERDGRPLYQSETLGRIWTDGLHRFGAFTAAAATYVGKYTVKKQGPTQWDDDDGYVDEWGEWHPRPQPFARMSLRPGIGTEWLRRYHTDLKDGTFINKGTRQALPRTYTELLKRDYPEIHEAAQHAKQRDRMRRGPSDNNTPERREAAEIIHKHRAKLTNRRTL